MKSMKFFALSLILTAFSFSIVVKALNLSETAHWNDTGFNLYNLPEGDWDKEGCYTTHWDKDEKPEPILRTECFNAQGLLIAGTMTNPEVTCPDPSMRKNCNGVFTCTKQCIGGSDEMPKDFSPEQTFEQAQAAVK